MFADAPVCGRNQKKVYGVARREKVLVRCEVEAEPGADAFRWRFNNSDENYDIPQMSFTTTRQGSVLTYTPMTEKDYGTLTCWGTNEVGQQQQPCVFQVCTELSMW
jgi:dual oxidase maturation factor 1